MLRLVGVTLYHQVPGTGELEQKLLEPQLVGLMNDDEEKLVVRGRVAEKLLESQQLGHLQVAPVRELAVLLTESGRARPGLAHVRSPLAAALGRSACAHGSPPHPRGPCPRPPARPPRRGWV